MGPVEGMVVMEELGRGIVRALCPDPDRGWRAGRLRAPGRQGRLAGPKIASGEALVVLAHQERAARYRLDICHTMAALAVGWALTGTKSLVPPGTRPTPSWCRPGQRQAGAVHRRAQRRRASPRRLRHAGRRPRAAGDAPTPPPRWSPPTALAALEHAVDIGIAATCAEAVGVMDKTTAITVEYMNTRKQFGVPIASFQALRHRVAT